MSRPYKTLVVTPEQYTQLQSLIRASSTAQSLVKRAKMIIFSHDGLTAEAIAQQESLHVATVRKWKNRFATHGIAGLQDAPRPGQPRKMTPEKAQQILTATVSQKPDGMSHWSLSTMAAHAGVTRWQVQQVWQASDLKPHRLRTFKLSKDPLFAEKVVDVVGLYLHPPDNALVLSVDEKTQIQALNRTQPLLPLRPGQVERRTHDYQRNGTTNLYAAMEISTSRVIGKISARHRAVEFIEFLQEIDRETPRELALHLIVDNSSTHKTQAVKQWLEKHPRFVLHFTPTSASWLNAVEGFFSRLHRQSLSRGVFTSVKELKHQIERYVEQNNQNQRPFQWTKSAQSILSTQEKLTNPINQMGH
jgi:transposase